MDQAGIIRDLLSWLEKNLDHPLSLDNVATKSGYSKWHLQRMFKDITDTPSALHPSQKAVQNRRVHHRAGAALPAGENASRPAA